MRLAIVGAGGFSREVADLALACGHTIVGFVDDYLRGEHLATGLPIVGSVGELPVDAAVIAIGDVVSRESMFERLREVVDLATLVHSSACLSPSAVLGRSSLVMQNVVVSAGACVGANVILNVGCYIAHDCVVGDHSHLAAAVQLGGGSSIGSRTLCGTSSVVLPRVRVGDRCLLGSGAVVTRDVADGVAVVGVPARPL